MMREEALRYLNLLSIFHYVIAGIGGLSACLPILHLVMGILLVMAALPGPEASPRVMDWFFIGIASTMIVFWAFQPRLIAKEQ